MENGCSTNYSPIFCTEGDYSDLGTNAGDVSAAVVRERGEKLAEAFGVDATAAATAVADRSVELSEAVAEPMSQD